MSTRMLIAIEDVNPETDTYIPQVNAGNRGTMGFTIVGKESNSEGGVPSYTLKLGNDRDVTIGAGSSVTVDRSDPRKLCSYSDDELQVELNERNIRRVRYYRQHVIELFEKMLDKIDDEDPGPDVGVMAAVTRVREAIEVEAALVRNWMSS